MPTELELTYDRFAALLCLDPEHDFESTPQPIRGTPDLTVVMPYEEYTKFLGDIPESIGMLHRPPSAAKQDTLRCYYFDIARAVVKEVYFCAKFGMTPTHIRHRFTGIPVTAASIDWRNYEDPFRIYVGKQGFDFVMADRVKSEWEYACLLCGYARQPNPQKWNII